jgi:hypothetical protein
MNGTQPTPGFERLNGDPVAARGIIALSVVAELS